MMIQRKELRRLERLNTSPFCTSLGDFSPLQGTFPVYQLLFDVGIGPSLLVSSSLNTSDLGLQGEVRLPADMKSQRRYVSRNDTKHR